MAWFSFLAVWNYYRLLPSITETQELVVPDNTYDFTILYLI